ncbi:MAG: DUF5060 domain-containing protein [Flavobacterium sp.]|nr:DUF5060 domain-containing protein [Flavobacterium sp.]
MKKNFIFSLLLIVLFKVNNSVAQCSPLYEESNGKLIIEAENLGTTGSWSKLTTTSGFTGSSYISWQGADSFNNPNQGVTNLQFRITTPGKYLFQWRTKVGEGTSPTDFNDTWLKFPDASSFYGQKDNTTAKVYPTGSGLSPNPNGAGANGFFKVYSTGTTNWTWASKVSDNDAHDVYVEFNSAGVYTLQIAARSKNHLIDRITLSRTGDATALTLQETKCSSTSNPNPVNIPDGQVNVLGELKKWHKVTLAMGGPFSSETANPNPAMDYKLTGIFTNGSQTFTVPGYFAADGDAGNSSATSGNVWKIHFTPPSTGTWNYTIRLRSGSKVAINSNITAGTAVTPLDGKTGSFTIAETNKTGRDLRAKGRLQYVGEHH